MEGMNSNVAEQDSKIQCIEVLISKTFKSGGSNLAWTLSVYSLENQPVQKDASFHNCDIFHFMIFDWRRTVRNLLDEHQVPYQIIQYFSPENIYGGVASSSFDTGLDYQRRILSALDQLQVAHCKSDDWNDAGLNQYLPDHSVDHTQR
jgi:hypothetical protein